MRSTKWGLCAAFLGLIVTGCDEGVSPSPPGGPTDPPVIDRKLAELVAVQSCDDLKAQIKSSALAWMNAELDANLKQDLEVHSYCYAAEDAAGGGPMPAAAGAPSTNKGGAGSYSTTNTQEADVDEADVMKNDGEYLYLLAKGQLQIVDVWPPEQAHVVSRTPIEGTPRKLFVDSDKAVIFASQEVLKQPGSRSGGPASTSIAPSERGSRECTYGYHCDFTGDGRALKVIVLDLSNRASPKREREIAFGGSLIGTRRIGDVVHTLVSAPEYSFPGVALRPQSSNRYSCSPLTDEEKEKLRNEYANLRAANTNLINLALLADWLPRVQDTRFLPGGPVTQSDLLASCQNFYASQTKDGAGFLVASSFTLNGTTPPNLTTIFGKPGAVYASSEALYVAARHTRGGGYGWFFEDGIDQATTIHKFALVNDSAVYQGSGVVSGRVINQYALDEHDGHLRIATTTGYAPSPEAFSTVSVLGQGQEGLDVVGSVGPLAPSEDIRSVRFEGDRGYVVTFKKTDPLFVIDLANPTKPVVKAELKIPGFSTYMHPLGPDHLLAIGYEADDQGSFAYFQGVLLQIFDVSNPSDPKLTHRKVLGTRGSSSEALTNPLAFNYLSPKGLLALPLTQCEASAGGGSYGTQVSFSGLKVFSVTTALGFAELGGVSHPLPQSQSSGYYGACSTWWTDATSYVKRSVFMDDYVVSIADDEVRLQKLGALGTDVSRVQLVP